MVELPKPNWDVWRLREIVSLWEAVALAANCDPEHVRYWDERKKRMYWQQGSLGENLETLSRVIQDTTHCPIVCVRYHGNGYAHEVRLGSFARWAVDDAGWKVPDELAALAGPKPDIDVHRWPWGNYETPLLRILVEVAAEFWEPPKIDGKPKQAAIEMFLKQKYPKLSQRERGAIDKMLRNDGD